MQWDQISSFPPWILTSAGPFDLSLEWQRESAPASPLWYDLQILRQKQSLNYPSRNQKVWKVPLRYCCPLGRQSHQKGADESWEVALAKSLPQALHGAEQSWTVKGRVILLNWFQNVDGPVFLLCFHSMKSLSLPSASVIHREIWVLTNSVAIILTTTLYILWLALDLDFRFRFRFRTRTTRRKMWLLSLCNSPDWMLWR